MQALLAALLAAVPTALTDEDAAIALVVRARWPNGPRCPRCSATCWHDRTALRCTTRGCTMGTFSIFVDTPLARLRRPRVRALLLAMRAMATSHNGVAIRPLATQLHVPITTLWRHVHQIRRAVWPARDPPTAHAVDVQVCGRRDEDVLPGTVVVGTAGARHVADAREAPARAGSSGRRLVGESIRTWLNGTFHGVRAAYLSLYLREWSARQAQPAPVMLASMLGAVLPPATAHAPRRTSA